MNRKFEGVWIEREVWLSKNLTLQEKVFFVEIKSLDNENGCFASNEYFAEFFDLSKRRCISVINSLEDKGLITKRFIYKKGSKQVDKRVIRVHKKYRSKLDTPGEETFTTPGEESFTTPVKETSPPWCNNVHHPGEETFTDNSTINSTINSTVEIERAREKTEQEAGKVTTLKAKKNDSPQVAARPPHELDAHLTEEIPDFDDTPDWTTVAREMADYFNGPGADQWQFMCNAAGGYVDPLVITTAWAGKNCDAPYLLRNWKKQTGKLTNWIRNNLNADKIQTAKIKTLKNGKQRSTSDPLISDEDMERAYRELLAEGYK